MTPTSLSTKQKHSHRQSNTLVLAKMGGGGVGKDWEFGIIRRKLLHIGWINNRPLLYGTGNDI